MMSACSGSPTAPSRGAQVAGAWTTNSTLTAIDGGECVGATLQAAGGRRDIVDAAIQQTGSVLTASATSIGNGTTCAYTGTVSGGSVSLTMTACQAGRVNGVRCGNGALRDLQMMSSRITATVNISGGVGTGPGTETSVWNVFVAGGATPLGALTLSATSAWIGVGLPSADYHEFTGTVAPGYQDGVISIGPADPFCLECGWFGSAR
jgi:hypothetical protein